MGYAGFKYFDECDALFRNSKGKIKPAPYVISTEASMASEVEKPQNGLQPDTRFLDFAVFDGSARDDVDRSQFIQVADTHCHLGMLPNPALALARSAVHGVEFICCMTDPSEKPSEDDDSARMTAGQTYDSISLWRAQAAKILDAWNASNAPLPQVRFAVGVHPHNAKYWKQSKDSLMALLELPETCCLGEIGLDYHYDFSPREEQRAVFSEQLEIARQHDVPVSLHIREAHSEALDILRAVGMPRAGCILHCFNLGPDDLVPFLELGCYVAFGGPLTFKKSDYVREAAALVPLDRLLTETDAPYMAPEPLRGTVCTPDMTIFTLATLINVINGKEVSTSSRASEASREISQRGAGPNREISSLGSSTLGRNDVEFAAQIYQNAIDLLGTKRG